MIKRIVSNKIIDLAIDEAQRIKDIGLILKIIIDNFKVVNVIATVSSSFELANELSEPLTGRKYIINLYPISFEEMVKENNLIEEIGNLERRLIFGCYPEIITNPGKEQELLRLISDSYLYKDILSVEKIRKPVLISKILKALALQIGNEVNNNEIAQIAGCDRSTVEKYLDILEKAFIIFQISAYSKNVRNEIKKNKKIYFFDNGIRNAVINNFSDLESRMDKGHLWENYIISERYKYLKNNSKERNLYFWRITQHQEIDLIEEDGTKITAYEIKYSKNSKYKFPKTFTTNYPGAEWQIMGTGLPAYIPVHDLTIHLPTLKLYAWTHGRSAYNISLPQVTGINQISETASEYNLFQNYPNPFNQFSIIQFVIPAVDSRPDKPGYKETHLRETLCLKW